MQTNQCNQATLLLEEKQSLRILMLNLLKHRASQQLLLRNLEHSNLQLHRLKIQQIRSQKHYPR